MNCVSAEVEWLKPFMFKLVIVILCICVCEMNKIIRYRFYYNTLNTEIIKKENFIYFCFLVFLALLSSLIDGFGMLLWREMESWVGFFVFCR